MAFVSRFCYQIGSFSGLQEVRIQCPHSLETVSSTEYGVEVLFHQAVRLSQLVMKTTETSTPSFYIQNPSGIRYLIREITSSTQHIVFNHLAYDPGTPVSARPFFYGAKLPAGSRLQVTSSGDTGAIEFSLVVEALPS